jgi:hypothetical protein
VSYLVMGEDVGESLVRDCFTSLHSSNFRVAYDAAKKGLKYGGLSIYPDDDYDGLEEYRAFVEEDYKRVISPYIHLFEESGMQCVRDCHVRQGSQLIVFGYQGLVFDQDPIAGEVKKLARDKNVSALVCFDYAGGPLAIQTDSDVDISTRLVSTHTFNGVPLSFDSHYEDLAFSCSKNRGPSSFATTLTEYRGTGYIIPTPQSCKLIPRD